MVQCLSAPVACARVNDGDPVETIGSAGGAAAVGARRPFDPTGWAILLGSLGVVAATGVECWHDAPGRVGAMGWSGRALLVLGPALILWARFTLGASYAPTPDHPDPAQRLVRRGPYRWLRHPMYLGDALAFLGLLLALERRWAFLSLVPLVLAILWRVRREERFMDERFGATWRSPPS